MGSPVGRTAWRGAAVGLIVAATWSLLTLTYGGFWRPDGGSDLHGYYLTRYIHVARSLRAFHVPLWDPWEFCGTSFFGSTQSGVLYPPIALFFGFFAPWTAVQLLYFFHAALFAIGAVRYLERLGTGMFPAAIGVFVGLVAIARGVGGFTQPNFFAGAAWAPWLLLVADDLSSIGARRSVAFVALAAAAQWASGYPDLAIDTSVLLGVYTVLRGWKDLPARVSALAVGLGLGALFAAVLLVPLSEAVAQSVRVVEQGTSYAVMRSIFAVQSMDDLGQGVLQRYGVAATILGIIGAIVPSPRRWPWIGAYLWALFALNPPLSALYALPVLSGLRLTVGWGYLSPMFAGFLIASGLQWSVRQPAIAMRWAGYALGVTAAANAGYLLLSAASHAADEAPQEAAVAYKAAVLQSLRVRFHQPRVLAGGELFTGIALRYGLSSPVGNDPLAPRLVDDLLDRMDFHLGQVVRWGRIAQQRDLLALLGTGLVAVPEVQAPAFQAAGFSVVSTSVPRARVMYRPALPRVRLVHEVVRVPDLQAGLEQVTKHAADAVHSCVVAEDEPVPPLESPPAGVPESATLVVDEPEELLIDVTAATAGLLVVTDSYYPGWIATIDDRPTPIIRANHAFRAVAVPPGTHRVQLRFSPASIRTGLWISGGAAAVLLALLM